MPAKLTECFGRGRGHHGHRRHNWRRPRIVNLSTPVQYSPPVVINRVVAPPRHNLIDIHTNLLAIIIIILVVSLLLYAMKK